MDGHKNIKAVFLTLATAAALTAGLGALDRAQAAGRLGTAPRQ